MSNDKNPVIVVKLKTGETFYSPIDPGISPSFINDQFLNEADFILFGITVVKRELIDYYTISWDAFNIYEQKNT